MKILQLIGLSRQIHKNNPETDNPKIVINGKTIFTIYKDGNGYYSALHYSKYLGYTQWLHTKISLITSNEYRFKTKELSYLMEMCQYFINSNQLEEVGQIKFIQNEH